MIEFEPHPDFIATSHPVSDLSLSHVRLHDDARFPWLILIPRRSGATELEHLSASDRATLMEEIVATGLAVGAVGATLDHPVEKLNVAQLGNITPQLHVHVIGRHAGDAAWPRPVFGVGTAETYGAVSLPSILAAARSALALT